MHALTLYTVTLLPIDCLLDVLALAYLQMFCLVFSTTENLAVFIFNQLREFLGEKGPLLYEVTVHETDNNTFSYRGE